MVCGAASRRRSYAAAARRRIVSESCGPERAFFRAAAARIDQFDHTAFCMAIFAAPQLKRPLHRSPGVRPGSEQSFLGAFVKFSSMSKLGFTK